MCHAVHPSVVGPFHLEVMTSSIDPNLKDFSNIDRDEARSVLLFSFMFNPEVTLVYIYVVVVGNFV